MKVTYILQAIEFISIVASLLEFGGIFGDGNADAGGMRQVRRTQKSGILGEQNGAIGTREDGHAGKLASGVRCACNQGRRDPNHLGSVGDEAGKKTV